MLFLRLFRESFLFAIHSIIVNKLRTVLSLLGITIGIFAIISVLTVVDSLERSIRNNIEKLGDNVLFIQKWPWAFNDPNFAWWDYMKRPPVSFDNYKILSSRINLAEAVTFMASQTCKTEFSYNSVDNVTLLAIGPDYPEVMYVDISEGRYFSSQEELSGKNVVIIGHSIAENLFEGNDPINKTIKINGQKASVIGVFAEEGESAFGSSSDESVMIPASYASNFMNINSDQTNPSIIAKAKKSISNDELRDEITGAMRAVRKLKPVADDDFSVNETSMLSEGLKEFFYILNISGWFIGLFSLLVGGFGIANIMFVSVKERTNIIGIQKSLGAKPYFILFEFLFEAIFLCLIGGSIGLLMVWGASFAGTGLTGMTMSLSAGNIITGFAVSFSIGLISGFIPAWTASRLDPVEAIRSGF